MQISREEHLKKCKENAIAQYNYDISAKEYSQRESACFNACMTMLSDLGKHPKTQGLAYNCYILMQTVTDYKSMMRFIEGFN